MIFFAYNPGVLSISADSASLMEGGYTILSLVLVLFFDDHQTCISKHNGFFKSTPQSPYIRLAVSPEMDRPAWFIYRQLPRSIIDGVTQRVCEQVPPSNEGRRLDALHGWIGNIGGSV